MIRLEEKIIVSACLAGIPCNYRGESKPNSQIINLVSLGKAIPVCPECLGGLSTPRPAAGRKEDKIITKDGLDVTAEFSAGAQAVLRIAKENGCKLAILKARSPSCGRDGITTQLLIENGIEVKSEEDL